MSQSVCPPWPCRSQVGGATGGLGGGIAVLCGMAIASTAAALGTEQAAGEEEKQRLYQLAAKVAALRDKQQQQVRALPGNNLVTGQPRPLLCWR